MRKKWYCIGIWTWGVFLFAGTGLTDTGIHTSSMPRIQGSQKQGQQYIPWKKNESWTAAPGGPFLFVKASYDSPVKTSDESSRRRDPFLPLSKATPVAKRAKIRNSVPQTSERLPLPGTLVSVVHGPRGYHAVIQLDSQEFLVVKPGEVVAETGWRVQQIEEGRIFLESSRTISASGHSEDIQLGVLSFP